MSVIVKPPFPNWSVANQYGTLSGNTAGASTYSGTNIVLAGGSNVTLSASGDQITINAAGATGTAGAAFLFSNSNGISWGTAGSVVTGTVATNYAAAAHSHTQYALLDRSTYWAQGGVVFSSTSPGAGIVYSDWLAGSSGYFMWVRIP